MPKDGALSVVENLLNLVLVYEFLVEKAFQTGFELDETVLLGLVQVHWSVLVQKVECEPQDLHQVRDGIEIRDLKIGLDED